MGTSSPDPRASPEPADTPTPPAPPAPPAPRLMRLEEHAAYTEHALDQLSGEIAELNKRLHNLTTRTELIEARLRRLLEPPAPVPEPPAPEEDA